MVYFTCEKDYFVENGVYTQNNLSFICAECISKRNVTLEKRGGGKQGCSFGVWQYTQGSSMALPKPKGAAPARIQTPHVSSFVGLHPESSTIVLSSLICKTRCPSR